MLMTRAQEGAEDYLAVLHADRSRLQAEQSSVRLHNEQWIATVRLIRALENSTKP